MSLVFCDNKIYLNKKLITSNVDNRLILCNEIKNIRGVVPRITRLDLSYNYVSDLTELDVGVELEYFIVRANSVQNIEDFNVGNLKKLDISENKIRSIIKLDIKNLQKLNISRNVLMDINGFNCKQLNSLNLRDNRISDISGFYPKMLNTLDLQSNRINDISNFALCDNLEYLDLSFNEISEVNDFNTRNLLSLNLSYNIIKNIDKFDTGIIRSLDLQHNNIRDVTHFVLNDALHFIDLSENLMYDINNLRDVIECQKEHQQYLYNKVKSARK